MSDRYSDVLWKAGALLFFEEKNAPMSEAGFRLPFTVDVARTFTHLQTVHEIANAFADVAKERGAKRILSLAPVMRPFAVFASEKARLPFCEVDDRNGASTIGAGKRSDSLLLIGDIAIGGNYGQDMIAALQKQSRRVTDVVFLVDMLTKGDEYEIARRKWLLREDIALHVLLPLSQWFRDAAQSNVFTEELAEHCVQYLHNPKRLSKDPLWWMKYHELLARNRII